MRLYLQHLLLSLGCCFFVNGVKHFWLGGWKHLVGGSKSFGLEDKGVLKKALLEKTQATSVSTPLLFPVAVWLVGWWQSTSPPDQLSDGQHQLFHLLTTQRSRHSNTTPQLSKNHTTSNSTFGKQFLFTLKPSHALRSCLNTMLALGEESF